MRAAHPSKCMRVLLIGATLGASSFAASGLRAETPLERRAAIVEMLARLKDAG